MFAFVVCRPKLTANLFIPLKNLVLANNHLLYNRHNCEGLSTKVVISLQIIEGTFYLLNTFGAHVRINLGCSTARMSQ